MSGRSRQCGCLSFTWTAVVLLALFSAGHCRVLPADHANCIGSGCTDIGPSYQVVVDNEIDKDAKEANTLLWEPGDLSIVSDKLSVFKDSNGDNKAIDDVKIESDNADGDHESTHIVDLLSQGPDDVAKEQKVVSHIVDLLSQGPDDVAKEQKVVYSFPYVFFRKIGVEKEAAGEEDASVKVGSSHILYGDYSEDTDPHGERESPNVIVHLISDNTEGEKVFGDFLQDFFKSITGTPNVEPTPAKRSDVNVASSALKVALEVAKELLTNMNEMHRRIDSGYRDSTNSGMILNGLFREHRSPGGENWNPWGWNSVFVSLDDVTNKDGNSYKSPNVNSHSVTEKSECEDIFHDLLLNNLFKSITGTPNEDLAPAKRNDVNDASSTLKVALEVAKGLRTMMNEIDKNIASSSRDSTISGKFLNGLFREHRSSGGENWNPWWWNSASDSSDDVTNIDRLLPSMISTMVQSAIGREPRRTSSMPELLWVIKFM